MSGRGRSVTKTAIDTVAWQALLRALIRAGHREL